MTPPPSSAAGPAGSDPAADDTSGNLDDPRAEWWRYDPARLDWTTVAIQDPEFRAPTPWRVAERASLWLFVPSLACLPILVMLAMFTDWVTGVWWALWGTAVVPSMFAGILSFTTVENQRTRRGTIDGATLEKMPASVRRPLARAVLAVNDIKAGRAHRDKFLGELALDAAIWRMAKTALLGGELTEACADVQRTQESVSAAAEATHRAHQTLAGLVADLERDAEALLTAAIAVRRLSAQLEDSREQERAEHERDRIAEQQIDCHRRLDTATAAAECAIGDPMPCDAADLATARADAYAEVVHITSGRIAKTPQQQQD